MTFYTLFICDVTVRYFMSNKNIHYLVCNLKIQCLGCILLFDKLENLTTNFHQLEPYVYLKNLQETTGSVILFSLFLINHDLLRLKLPIIKNKEVFRTM